MTAGCEEVCGTLKQLQAKLEQLKKLGEKYSVATEFYDELIEGQFVKMPPLAKKFTQQAGRKILQILSKEK